MTDPRFCHGHPNKLLYRAFWILLVLVLCLSLTLSMAISLLLKPRMIQFKDDESIVIILDLPSSNDRENTHDQIVP